MGTTTEAATATARPAISALGLVARLLVARGRNRADLCYEFMGTKNRMADDCTFLNCGYWANTKDYRTAAEALVDVLADAAQIAPGDKLVAAGCGFGDQDVHIARTRAPARIVAVNVTRLQVDEARLRNPAPGIEYLHASATAVPEPDAAFDAVISLEAAFHFDTRAGFLREAWRLLRPGGRLGIIDMLPLERNGRVLTGGLRGAMERWSTQIPQANVYGITKYREILAEIGFQSIELRSIRDQVFPAFLNRMRERLDEPAAKAAMHPLLRLAMRHAIPNPFAALDYIVVSARKPIDTA